MRNKHLLVLLTCLLSCMVFCSCEYGYQYTYVIYNNADTTVTLHLKRTVYPDTTIIISSQVSDTLFITQHGLESAHGPYFKSVTTDLSTATVSKNGRPSRKDYLKDTTWIYKKGVYTSVVQNQDF